MANSKSESESNPAFVQPRRSRYVEHLTAGLIIAASGAIGANVRYFSGLTIHHWLGDHFPWGTFFVNITGSLLMGFLTGWIAQSSLSPNYRLFFLTGFLGSYTTFSSYSIDALRLWERAEFSKSLVYLSASVILGFSACAIGVWLARWLFVNEMGA